MPFIQIKVKKGGKLETDYEGYPNSMCNQAEQEFKDRVKNLKLETIDEEPKDDELLQEETHYE